MSKPGFAPSTKQLLHLITATGKQAFIVSDAKLTVTGWSADAEALFGWPAKEALGRELTGLIIAPSERPVYEDAVRHLSEISRQTEPKTLRLPGRRRDGAQLDMAVHLAWLEFDERMQRLLPRADPAYAHQWLTAAALTLSGRDRVYLRDDWQPAQGPYVPPCAPDRVRFAVLCT